MTRKGLAIFLVFALILAYIPVSSGLAQENQGVSRTRYIIELNHGSNENVKNLIRGLGGATKHDFPQWNMMSADLPESAVKGLRKNPNIKSVELAVIAHATEDILDWGVNKIDAEVVWGGIDGAKNVTMNVAGDGVTVAIIDTGIDMDHPDLEENIVGGINYVTRFGVFDYDYDDDNGHGTHCAGIVAALDNGSDVIGVAPKASLLGVKVLNRKGYGNDDDIAAGIVWAVANEANIISLSLGARDTLVATELACQAADTAGVLVVAAAGNNNQTYNAVISPAVNDSVIAVAATTSDDERAYFSTTGPKVELAAPGYGILSDKMRGGTTVKSGTSMATPMVAGVAALVMSAKETLTDDQVRTILQNTAFDINDDGRDNEFGYGRVDAVAAVAATGVVPQPIVVDTEPPTVSITSPSSGAVFDLVSNPDVNPVTITANANDNIGVKEVKFYYDGIDIGADDTAPYSVEWNISNLEGAYDLTAEAFDAKGNSATSNPVNVTVDNVSTPVSDFTSQVVDFNYKEHPVKEYANVSATILVKDSNGNPVSDVNVKGKWIYNEMDKTEVNDFTDDNGLVTFELSKEPKGSYVFEPIDPPLAPAP